ncbi:MAG: Geranylgeranyl reductase, partial [Blastococcus sp.]|nr:Geranylgeranyl reductase [Blastococcus sp.]
MEHWDVVVVGGGPAGAACAAAARRADPTARVLVLDRAGFPRDKVCGDGIAPEALDVL